MKHNLYFEGKVQSLSVNTLEGEATIGVITPGKYTFSTSTEEKMIITSGRLKVKLPNEDWKEFLLGQEFVIAKGNSFDVEAISDVSYICYYK